MQSLGLRTPLKASCRTCETPDLEVRLEVLGSGRIGFPNEFEAEIPPTPACRRVVGVLVGAGFGLPVEVTAGEVPDFGRDGVPDGGIHALFEGVDVPANLFENDLGGHVSGRVQAVHGTSSRRIGRLTATYDQLRKIGGQGSVERRARGEKPVPEHPEDDIDKGVLRDPRTPLSSPLRAIENLRERLAPALEKLRAKEGCEGGVELGFRHQGAQDARRGLPAASGERRRQEHVQITTQRTRIGSLHPRGAISARIGMPGTAGLAAINGAVEAIVKPLAAELAPIRVNGVSPGVVDTPWWSAMPDEQREAYFAQIADALPVGRVGLPDDVAECLILAATNPNVTGTVIERDGGARLAPMG